MSRAAAPITTTSEPITVSARSYPMKRGVMRLSTMLDCWKKSCHGATVVPTMAMISSTAPELTPPSIPGTTKSCAALPHCGSASKNIGICSSVIAMKTNMARSQRRKLPVAMIRIRAMAARGTV
ncbi:Uncharacterised protein [Mycobacteroides abscessus]|nr:Uncharacterised protein [Mycobacteroides abscessus]SII84252.1 Uncharacterised protein [Mycobacteroides abscessus subsp. abscessus]